MITEGLFLGDARELIAEVPDESVDFVLTDPPYAREYLYLYEFLARDVARVMKPGASLITISGHATIHDILDLFEQHGQLRFRWPLCMWQPGRHAKLSMGVEVTFKPLLWYVRGKFPVIDQRSRGFVSDGIEMPTSSTGTKKANHKWEQASKWAEYYIERLTNPGALVFDPFSGSGTVALAAKSLGRRYLAFEVDQTAFETAQRRLAESDPGH
jgi:16S rRNA G966 N2-methylase RsmD